MKLIAVAVRDSALQAFMRPFFVPTIPVAHRMFVDEVNRAAEDNPLYKHPDDHELHVLAEFDEESGEFFPPSEGRRCLVRAKDVKKS